jgi:hypothetical protein
MYKWQKEYLEEIKKKTNEEVLDEYTYLAGGDDYDGCYTSQGEWKWKKIQEELNNRLREIGFI